MKNILLGLILALVIPAITYAKKSLSLAASVEAGILIFICSFCGGYKAVWLLVISYFVIALIDILTKKKSKPITEKINKKSGPRDAVQVIANGLPALVFIVFFYGINKKVCVVAYTACLAEALADSMSSDIGVLSNRKPVSIFRLKPIETGLSGGVSLLGSLSCLVGSIIVSTMYYAFYHNLGGFITIIIASVIGCFIDTFLGDLLQVKYECVICGLTTEKDTHCGKKCKKTSGISRLDNCLVNLISNAFTGVLALMIYVWLF